MKTLRLPVVRLAWRPAWEPCRRGVARRVCGGLAVVALALPLLLAACGGPATATSPPPPTSVEISRTVPAFLQGPPFYFPPLHMLIADPAAVRAFYTQTLALPRYPVATSGTPFNGCSTLIPYQLTFRREATTVLTVTILYGPCGFLNIITRQGQPVNESRAYDTAYERALARLLGLTVAQLYPVAHPASTPTPTATR